MVRNLETGEKVTVTRTVTFKEDSEPYQKGLTHVEPGQVGKVIGRATEGRATLVVLFYHIVTLFYCCLPTS